MKTDTPRTDAHNKVVCERGGFLFPGDIDFMRQLERENAAGAYCVQVTETVKGEYEDIIYTAPA